MKNFLTVLIFSVIVVSGWVVSPVMAATDPIESLPAGVYQLEETHASLVWKVSHMGLSYYTARFTRFDASIVLDPQNIEKSSVTADIDASSVRTDYPYPEKKDFDAKVAQGEDWLNAGAHPSITFQSTKVIKTGENTGTVTGDLTLLGVTKTVTLDVVFNGAMVQHPYQKKAALGFSAHGVIKRTDFGFDTYVPNIGDEVEIIIEAEFVKADE